MSTQEFIKESLPAIEGNLPKRRGRPPKNPEDKIQDLKAYMKDWHKSHKDDEDLIQRQRAITNEKQKRTRELYTLVKNLLKSNQLVVPEEFKKDFQRSTMIDI